MPSVENLRFDTRLIRRNLKRGVIKQEELKAHLDSLEDVSARAEWIEVLPEEGERPEPRSTYEKDNAGDDD